MITMHKFHIEVNGTTLMGNIETTRTLIYLCTTERSTNQLGNFQHHQNNCLVVLEAFL